MTRLFSSFSFVIILFTTIVFHPLSNDSGQNLLMLAVMACCVLLVPLNIRKFEKIDFFLVVVVCLQLSASITHPESFRLSTVLYSGLFFIQFAVFKIYAKKQISLDRYMYFIRFLITIFFIVLVLQQMMELIGLEGFNRNGYFHNRWKMNSLAQEPSTVPTTLAILIISYAKMIQLKTGCSKKISQIFLFDKRTFLFALYTFFGCGTTSCIFIFPILALYFFKNKFFQKIPLIIIVSIAVYLTISFLTPQTILRFNAIMGAIGSMDPAKLYAADTSGSARIAPYMILINEINLFNPNFWVGHGVDYATHHLSEILVGRTYGSEIGIGGIVNFLYDYGLFSFILFIGYLKKNCLNKFLGYDFILWLLVFSIAQMNVASFWFPMYFMYVNKNMEKSLSPFYTRSIGVDK